MEDADDSSYINFDAVRLDLKHWCIEVNGTLSPAPFSTHESAAAAARAQARQYTLHSGLSTRVRITTAIMRIKVTSIYDQNTLDRIADVLMDFSPIVSKHEKLVSDTELKKDARHCHTDPVAPVRTDMDTSDRASQSLALVLASLWSRDVATWLDISPDTGLWLASRFTTPKGVAS